MYSFQPPLVQIDVFGNPSNYDLQNHHKFAILNHQISTANNLGIATHIDAEWHCNNKFSRRK
jgi:hypothetical protein